MADLKVRVRIAPSPTGYVHVGNTYTALFNYAFAKQQKGEFILRLDDTDQARHIQDAEREIYRLWRWLGIQWDKGPDLVRDQGETDLRESYRQSERLERYRAAAAELLAKDLAYHHEGAIFLRVANEGNVEFTDMVRGVVRVQKSEIKDQVLIKSGAHNHYPTYMFASVVDDIDFGITHVIRAEDHLSNTHKQILMFQALEARLPEFAHLPLLRNLDRSKLSKRHGHASLAWYQEQGYLPEAICNYLMSLGWTHPKAQEVFDLDEFTQYFRLEDVKTTAPVFDLDKLAWLSGQYMRAKHDDELVDLILRHVQKFNPEFYQQLNTERGYLMQVTRLAKERLRRLGDFLEQNWYFFETPQVETAQVDRFFQDAVERQNFLARVTEVIGDSKTEWHAASLEERLRDLREDMDLNQKSAFMALRWVVTGQKVSPPIFDTLEVLGRDRVLARLRAWM